MEIKRINQILMRMGGNKCNISHLLKNEFCSEQEINDMIDGGYLIKFGDKVMKTNKAKELW